MFVASALFLGGCTTGSAGDDVIIPGDDSQSVDQITCQTEMALSGTWTEGYPKPTSITGCWPVGTWSFSGSVLNNDCTPAPTVPSNFTFTVTRDTSAAEPDYEWLFDYPADPTAEIKVTSGGGGLCEGTLSIYATSDGKGVYTLKPALPDTNLDGLADGTIAGHGTYQLHTTDQRPMPE